jgi:hypothetical protein
LGYWLKLYVPLPVALKSEVMRVCRERRISQAELGLRLVQTAFSHEGLLAFLLDRVADAGPVGAQPASTDGVRVVGDDVGEWDEEVVYEPV